MENKMQINNPRGVGRLVPTLARLMSEHKSNTLVVPDLINMLFEKYPDGTIKYKHFIIPHTGEEIRHETLDSFLAAHTPHGLQCTREDLRMWAEFVPDRIKQAVKDELYEELDTHGVNQHSKRGVDNITSSKNEGMKRGTSEHYIVSRLKRDNPEVAQKVLSGELSANQAAIKTGIRKKYIQVQLCPTKIAKKLKAIWTKEQLEEFYILVWGAPTPLPLK